MKRVDDETSVQVSLGDGASVPMPLAEIERAVRRALAAESVNAAEVSVALLDDARIAELNVQYLAHAGPTDVLSFALHEPGEPPLGDIYIGVEQAARQAAEHGVSLEEEILRLAIHGALHVLGYDHARGEERLEGEMFRRQEALLREIVEG